MRANFCGFGRKVCALLHRNRNLRCLNRLKSYQGDLSFHNDLGSPLNHALLVNPDIFAELISPCTQETNSEAPNP